MFETFDNRVKLSGTLTTLTALRIGAGRATGVSGSDLPVVRDAVGRPYIPGSSFKGALRAAVEALVRGVLPMREPPDEKVRKAACNPVNKVDWCLDSAEGLSDKEVEKKTCLVCRVFGSPWLAAKVSIRDLLVDESAWFGQYEVRNGVAIDRDTGTASDKKLYDFEVVPAGTRFSCEVVAENAGDWELGLLMAGLRPFEAGDAVLGGARSRGLGVVKIKWDTQTRITGSNLLDYLADGSPGEDIGDGKRKVWFDELRAKLKEVANA